MFAQPQNPTWLPPERQTIVDSFRALLNKKRGRHPKAITVVPQFPPEAIVTPGRSQPRGVAW